MKLDTYTGVVCGFQFFDSLAVKAFREDLELKHECSLKFLSVKDSIEAGATWSPHLSNVFFVYFLDAEKSISTNELQALVSFIEKHNMYVLSCYDRGKFIGISDLLQLCKELPYTNLRTLGCIPVFSVLRLVSSLPIKSISAVTCLLSKGDSKE